MQFGLKIEKQVVKKENVGSGAKKAAPKPLKPQTIVSSKVPTSLNSPKPILFATPSSSKLITGSSAKNEPETPTPFFKTFN